MSTYREARDRAEAQLRDAVVNAFIYMSMDEILDTIEEIDGELDFELDHEVRYERAMEAGMLHGIDAYNDEMGY